MDRQSRLGEGDSQRAQTAESPPHPTEYADTSEMPSPRKRGEGASMRAALAAARHTNSLCCAISSRMMSSTDVRLGPNSLA
jgi:hypothetical protein